MSTRRIVPRLQAQRDIDDAVDYYLEGGAGPAALAFIDALEQAFAHLGRHPAIGSLRYAHELGLPGLRCWPLRRHPYLIFYVEHDDHVDVWRVLHAERDIPSWMQGTAKI